MVNLRHACPTGQIVERICEEGNVNPVSPDVSTKRRQQTDVTLLEVLPLLQRSGSLHHLIDEQPTSFQHNPERGRN